MKGLDKNQDKYHIIHLLDCIYYGNLNYSYQKEGFGIQQSFDFHTYIGYWKSNRIQGLGLIILESGELVYGNFKQDEIDGLGIVDNGTTLRCGIFKNSQIVGVGYEYNYGLKNWKMSRYHKGISIETMKQETCDIAHELPKMVKIEQSIYFHLYHYLHKIYFPELSFQICQISQKATQNHSHNDQQIIFQYGIQNQNGIKGPGISISQFKVIEAGFYENGQLHGYGFKRFFADMSDKFEFGFYDRGRRDGLFIIKDSDKNRVFEYRKGAVLKNSAENQQQIFKNQRKYNFNQKDFFSAKNGINFSAFKSLTVPLQVRLYQDKKAKVMNETQAAVKFQPSRRLQAQRMNKNMDMIIKDKREKSSVQIMRQKISHYYGIVSSARKRRESIQSVGKAGKQMEHEEDDIAIQQNPFGAS